MVDLFGVLAGVLSAFAYLPYIRDTLRGDTRPERASWLIWSLLGSIAFFSQMYEGATHSLWLGGIQVLGTIVVFLLSIKRGMGGFLNKSDQKVLAVACVGLILWYFASTAVYALAIIISINLLGGWVTITKAYRDPQSETLLTWTVSMGASSLGVLAVGDWDWIVLAYPLYLLVLNTAIVSAILLGKAALLPRSATASV